MEVKPPPPNSGNKNWFGPVWSNLIPFEQIWSDFIWFEQIINLIQLDLIWFDLIWFEPISTNFYQFDTSGSYLNQIIQVGFKIWDNKQDMANF